ncbi:MAG: hypothetical protein AAF446_02440 [Pseudomonadota bacterium]
MKSLQRLSISFAKLLVQSTPSIAASPVGAAQLSPATALVHHGDLGRYDRPQHCFWNRVQNQHVDCEKAIDDQKVYCTIATGFYRDCTPIADQHFFDDGGFFLF